MNQPTVLIIADDAEFARTLLSRWQMERNVPAFTLMSSDLWSGGTSAEYELAIVGPVAGNRGSSILKTLDAASSPTVFVSSEGNSLQACRTANPRIIAVPQGENWAEIVSVLGTEVLRRIDVLARAKRAEQAAAASQRYATLGRYMLEMRHSLNNALTSVLGNAELLLLEPGAFSAEIREQLETIHNMALRLHEIMQRFSSIESEMQFAEKESQAETKSASHAYVAGT